MASPQRVILIDRNAVATIETSSWKVFSGRPQQNRGPQRASSILEGALVSTALAAIALLIHGYHPYAEDGGLYFSAVLRELHPNLYPSWSMSSALDRHSMFAPLVAAFVRLSGLQPAGAMFLLYLASVWSTIFAGWLVITRCFSSRFAPYGAASLLGVWLTLPVAGTSLLLVDPYLSARSISTPCSLFAMAAMLDIVRVGRRKWISLSRDGIVLAVSMTIAGLVHPLMAGYIAGSLALLFAASRPQKAVRTWAMAGLCGFALLLAGILFKLEPHATPDYLLAARTRTYWFLQNWHWYEIAGLITPLLLLGALLRTRLRHAEAGARCLARAAIAAGSTAIAISLLFVHESSGSCQLAMLQPLRIFHFVYLVMILLLGAVAGERLLAAARSQAVWAFLLLGGIMLCVQLSTFPGSAHVELPWNAARNGWEQVFLWIRQNTPPQALFALDARYINYPGEDAQYFNAIAERSSLPDYSKDGGLAAISPDLAKEWELGQEVQTGLNSATDEQRVSSLRRFSIEWIVLPAGSVTALPCPFQNASGKVCRITQ